MIEIGGKPILWHIMKIYSHHGINDFVICLGYKGYIIKEYFANYFLHTSDVTIDIANPNRMKVHRNYAEPWTVTLVDTGENSMVGGRIKHILPHVHEDPYFCLTYGDGVGDIDITQCIELHKTEERLATVTAAQQPGRFGVIRHDGKRLIAFEEKPHGDGGWINAGFFVLSPKVGDYIEGEMTVWEREPLEDLAKDEQLSVYLHKGFWQPMDTLRDKKYLEELWVSNNAPWKIW
jgi:glucose-1-phosphate cytidylyltransferase